MLERKRKRTGGKKARVTGSLFSAEAAYADSMLQSALGNNQVCIEALRRSLDFMPTYAPALMSLGSVEYQ